MSENEGSKKKYKWYDLHIFGIDINPWIIFRAWRVRILAKRQHLRTDIGTLVFARNN